MAALIVAVSAALIGGVLVKQHRSAPPESTTRSTSPGVDMAINKLHFSEMRADAKLWDLAAERAEYDKETGTTTLLDVRAEIYGDKAGSLEITSKRGSYDEPRKLVVMQQQVHAVTKRGMVFDTDRLEYRTIPGQIATAQPVTVHDGRLTLHARGMVLSLQDEQVSFKGPVEAVIEGYHGKR